MTEFEIPGHYKAPEIPDQDGRAVFGNAIAQLLFDRYGSIDKALEHWSAFDGHLEEYVRNIYELDNKIPLKMLYHLTTNEWTNFDFESEEHYNWVIIETKKACERYYYKEK